MRRDQIAPSLQPYLRPIEGLPHACALVAAPTPRRLVLDPVSHHLTLEAIRSLGQLQGHVENRPGTDLLTRTLARREAVQSSQIEGTQAKLDDLLAYEITRNTAGQPPDVVVTERYVEALQIGLDEVRRSGRAGLDLELVHAMHAVLMRDAGDGFPAGRYRQELVWIGSSRRIEDARFVPAPPAEIDACMREFEHNALQYRSREDEQTHLHVVVQLAIAHAQFETIHPYKDGNGRTGRLLMPLILQAEGYPPLYLSGSLLRSRQEYYDALSRVQLQNDWNPWVQMLCRAIVESVQDAMSIAGDLDALLVQWRPLVGKHRGDSVARRLPPLLIGYPTVDPRRVCELLLVSDRAARTGIGHLVDAGILTEQTGKKRSRVWEAREVIERLNQPPRR